MERNNHFCNILYIDTMRLDVYLVEKGICTSRERAKDLILKGSVRVKGLYASKPSFNVSPDDVVEFVTEDILPYVSKGGLKLEKAIRAFEINFSDKLVLDMGASTGGFTDCALKHGAKFVWAVDVGTNQLDTSLKGNSRICSIENTDVRYLDFSQVGEKVDFVIGDLSFISLTHILKIIPNFLKDDGFAILLIKPQFEVGPENVGKGGIVKNPKQHVKVIKQICTNASEFHLYLLRLTYAPVVDSRKNIEYLALFGRRNQNSFNIEEVVSSAFAEKKEF